MREGSCYHAIAYRRSWNYGMTAHEINYYRNVKKQSYERFLERQAKHP